MAKLEYDKSGRLLFTKEMKQEYKVLIPQMLPIHWSLISRIFHAFGYNTEVLETTHRAVVDEGLMHVHNDTCYPALLVIGQMIDALKSKKYELDKTALIITQTGGGCRASNYIHLLRKALKRAGLEHIPVISLNIGGLENNPGFKLTYSLIKELFYSLMYGDLLMMLANQCRPYETVRGSTDALVERWVGNIIESFGVRKGRTFKTVRANFYRIVEDFNALQRTSEPKIRVGVVGEIYIKYAPLGNNNLEDFLLSEGAEVVVPGIMDFIIFKADNRVADVNLYGGNPLKRMVFSKFVRMFEGWQRDMITAIRKRSDFRPPTQYKHISELADGYVGKGNKMGEGWLLTAEMLELIEQNVPNIVCTQPFGCLPNHISGKGMIRLIKQNHPEANIVAIDYDPGATKINQENRIKLMLANAAKEGIKTDENVK